MKNPVFSGGAGGGRCGRREQDGGDDQQQECPEPCQEEPEVVADGAKQDVGDVSLGALECGFRCYPAGHSDLKPVAVPT